VLEIKVKGS